MTTALVTHAWLDNPLIGYRGEDGGCRRVERFLHHYGGVYPTILLDNGSSPQTCERLARQYEIEIVNLQPNYARGAFTQHDYQNVWRVYWHLKELFQRFDRIFFLATDAYITSQRLWDYLDSLQSGWTTLWCPVYQCPASEIQVIARGCREFENFFSGECDPAKFNGLWEEITLPFTSVVKGYWGDRFGEFTALPWINYEVGMDYYTQAPDDPQFDDEQFPVIRRVDGCIIVKGGFAKPVSGHGETSRIREFVLPLIKPGMTVLDLGYGGDAICPTAITMDQQARYADMGSDPQHLTGDARSLKWFADGSIDMIYSSHLLEDFFPIEPVLHEWLRVIRPGGLLALYLPNEQRFRAHCDATGQAYNENHRCLEMSLDYMRSVFAGMDVRIVLERDEPHGYGFLIVVAKS